MEALELIEELEDIIDRGVHMPFTGRCLLDKEELLDLIQEIKLNLPDDLKQAKWVKEERQRILQEAQKEAGDIIKNAEDKIISMINENEITKKAVEQANDMIEKAQNKTKEMNLSAYTYADGLLAKIEDGIIDVIQLSQQVSEEVRRNRQELRK